MVLSIQMLGRGSDRVLFYGDTAWFSQNLGYQAFVEARRLPSSGIWRFIVPTVGMGVGQWGAQIHRLPELENK